MEKRRAIVLGATGLVGSELVKLLLVDDRFYSVIALLRRTTGIKHEKLREFIIDLDNPDQWKNLVRGDVLFSALGTTLRQAGSKEAQYKVDHSYQYNVARAAAENGVPVYVLVSAAMSGEHSKIFYSRIKGELESDVKKLPFKSIHILQPGMLEGKRINERLGEKIGISVLKFINRLGIARNQKPVPANIVAQAMINLSFEQKSSTIKLLEIFEKAGAYRNT